MIFTSVFKTKPVFTRASFNSSISSISVAEKTNPTEITIADLMPAEQSY
jgi:tRNA A37 threonylcarbamoyladenosine dehydratase